MALKQHDVVQVVSMASNDKNVLESRVLDLENQLEQTKQEKYGLLSDLQHMISLLKAKNPEMFMNKIGLSQMCCEQMH